MSANTTTLWLPSAVMLLGALCVSAQSTNRAPALDFDSFRIVAERNIFNPNRYARSASGRRESAPQARVDSFALVGTMSYEKGPLAFFDGTRSEYRKAAKPNDTIAGYTIAGIAPTRVKLASATNEIELPVGMQLRREDTGEWTLSARAEPAPYSPPAGRSAAAATVASAVPSAAALPDNALPPLVATDGEPPPFDPEAEAPPPGGPAGVTNSPPATGGGESDVLQRLMQRREQELNR